MTDDLFAAMDASDDVTRPLAVRMRPSSIDEVLGQSRVQVVGMISFMALWIVSDNAALLPGCRRMRRRSPSRVRLGL